MLLEVDVEPKCVSSATGSGGMFQALQEADVVFQAEFSTPLEDIKTRIRSNERGTAKQKNALHNLAEELSIQVASTLRLN